VAHCYQVAIVREVIASVINGNHRIVGDHENRPRCDALDTLGDWKRAMRLKTRINRLEEQLRRPDRGLSAGAIGIYNV
jgi:hypothetical protein